MLQLGVLPTITSLRYYQLMKRGHRKSLLKIFFFRCNARAFFLSISIPNNKRRSVSVNRGFRFLFGPFCHFLFVVLPTNTTHESKKTIRFFLFAPTDTISLLPCWASRGLPAGPGWRPCGVRAVGPHKELEGTTRGDWRRASQSRPTAELVPVPSLMLARWCRRGQRRGGERVDWRRAEDPHQVAAVRAA